MDIPDGKLSESVSSHLLFFRSTPRRGAGENGRRPGEGEVYKVKNGMHPFAKVAGWGKANSVAPDHILLGKFGAIRPENFDARKERWRTAFGISKTFNRREFDPVMAKASTGK